jgi:hypothetical protein
MSDYVYDLPTSGELYEILNGTIAPNLTFTQCNLFECLEQIFMYLDGYPVLDNNNVLGIRYFNDNNGEVVDSKEIDSKRTLNEKRFVNGFISDYQKGTLNNELIYPSRVFMSGIQSKKLGLGDDDLVMRVDYPLYKLKEVLVSPPTANIVVVLRRIPGSESAEYNFVFKNPVDITYFCVEKEIYSNLLTEDFYNGTERVKENCFTYEQNGKEIDVGQTYKVWFLDQTAKVSNNVIKSALKRLLGLNFVINNNQNILWMRDGEYLARDIKYQIRYETLTDGRLLIETNENRFEGSERLDIGQGATDIMKMGLNLYGTSLKSGNAELIRTEKFAKTQNRKKVGSLYYENGDRYIATSVSEVVNGDYIVSTINYTKNFNKLSNFIELDQKKRFNEVDSSLVLRSEDIYKEYLYFSLKNDTQLANKIHVNSDLLYNGLTNTFLKNPTAYKLDLATCETETINGEKNRDGVVLLPITPYGSGNALCFEMSFNSPLIANTNFKLNQYNQWESKNVFYANQDGFADYFTINFYRTRKKLILNDLPQIDKKILTNEYITHLGGFSNLLYYKKPNEIFSLNYELICLPYQNQDLFIGENFIKYNGIIGAQQPKKTLKLLISDNELYSVLDKKGFGSTAKSNITLQVQNAYATENSYISAYVCSVESFSLDKAIKSWAIVDSDDNILISANQNLAINDRIIFYIFTSHNRL